MSALETGCCARAAVLASVVKAISLRKNLCRGSIFLTGDLSRGESPKRRIVKVDPEQQLATALYRGDLARIVTFNTGTAISPIRSMDGYRVA